MTFKLVYNPLYKKIDFIITMTQRKLLIKTYFPGNRLKASSWRSMAFALAPKLKNEEN